jgi:hypothetical protein
MACLSAAGLEVQELGFMALEGCRDGLLGLFVDEFTDVEGSGIGRSVIEEEVEC